MTDRDRLAADLVSALHDPGSEYDIADRLIALGWTRLDEERLARALLAYSEEIDPREPLPDGWEYGETVAVALIDHPTKLAAAIAKAYREDAG